ncbi:MAG: enoyl-CoA hydratase-related protein, partial [Acidiferrobacterales bacterium]
KLKAIEADAATRVVVLTGAGKIFSSGADLEWMRAMANYDQETNRQDALRLAELMEVLNSLPKPTIACVNGSAFAGAVGLIACCDIAVANKQAEFALTEVRLGLAPAVISLYVMAAIGERQARRLFLSAERITATEAHRIGLVHEVASTDTLQESVERQVNYLLKAGPEALAACKRLVVKRTPREVVEETVDMIAQLRASPEGQEGMAAFFEKRKPKWVQD